MVPNPVLRTPVKLLRKNENGPVTLCLAKCCSAVYWIATSAERSPHTIVFTLFNQKLYKNMKLELEGMLLSKQKFYAMNILYGKTCYRMEHNQLTHQNKKYTKAQKVQRYSETVLKLLSEMVGK